MKTWPCFVAVISLLSAEESPIAPPLVERMKQASMDSFKLDRASIHEALALIKGEWIRQYPGESFPVVLIEPESYGNPLITLDLRNVPFWVAVQALGHATGLAVHDDGPTIRLDTDYEEDLATKVFVVNDTVVRQLGLTTDGTFQKINPALARFGLRFADPCLAVLSPDGTSITVRQTPNQLRLIPGILHLLAKGFAIEPPSAPTDAPK